MELTVQVEKTSNIHRKLSIKVPSKIVDAEIQKGLVALQRTAKIKGFRPGMVPLPVVKQYYGADLRHRVFHDLIDDAYREAIRKEKLRAVSAPQIETAEELKTGAGEHDHEIKEGHDLNFTATVEVLPEIEVKGYTGLSLNQESSDVTEEDLTKLLSRFQDNHADLNPADEGAKAAKGDYVDLHFKGGVVNEGQVDYRADMEGSRLIEIGSDSLIPGFEDQLVGLTSGGEKTFRIHFPTPYAEKSLEGKEAEFSVKVNSIKVKKLPELNDEFAKTVGYESVEDMKAKAREHLQAQKTEEVDRKLKSDLLAAIIEKNPFDVPQSLVQAQTRSLAQDIAANLRGQGFTDQMIQEALTAELGALKTRAENQVRASLLLDSIAKSEGISVAAEEVEAEIAKMAANAKMESEKVREFYEKNPSRRDDIEFRIKEDRTMTFLLEKAKVKKAK